MAGATPAAHGVTIRAPLLIEIVQRANERAQICLASLYPSFAETTVSDPRETYWLHACDGVRKYVAGEERSRSPVVRHGPLIVSRTAHKPWRVLQEQIASEALLWFAESRRCHFRADVPDPEEQAGLRESLRALGVTDVSYAGSEVAGRLTPEVVDALLTVEQLVLDVYERPRERLHLHDSVEDLLVTISVTELTDLLRRLTALCE